MKTKTHKQLITSMYNPRYQSVFWCILGPNQTGKTATALYIMNRCYELGLYKYFAGNNPLEDPPFPYEFIEDLPTLREYCTMLNKKVLYLADEIGAWAPKDQPWLNVKLIQELQKVRKYKLFMIACAVDRVDSRILSEKFFHGVLEKKSKRRPDRAIIRDWVNHRKGKIFDLPDSPVQFDTWYPAMFYLTRQSTDGLRLTPEHKIIKRYIECGSWQKADIHPQEGKRAIMKVLRYHLDHCLMQDVEVKEESTHHELTNAS